jgi:hypothetical protein
VGRPFRAAGKSTAFGLALMAGCAQRLPAPQTAPSGPATSCAALPKDTSWIMINATLPRTARSVLDSAQVVLVRQGFVLEPRTGPNSRLETAPRFTWPEGTAAEDWHGEANPGVRVVVSAEPRSADSAAVSIAARAVCAVAAPGSSVPSDEVGETLRMITALQVTNAIRKALGR